MERSRFDFLLQLDLTFQLWTYYFLTLNLSVPLCELGVIEHFAWPLTYRLVLVNAYSL